MKTLILFISLLALCSCNGFLRNAAAGDLGTISAFAFPSCVSTLAADLPTFNATTDNQFTHTGSLTAVTTLHTGSAATNDLTYNCVFPSTATAATTTGTCTVVGTPSPIVGTYIFC